MEDLMAMKLHEELNINSNVAVIRVPGGWLYRFEFKYESTGEWDVSMQFVPEPPQ